MFCDVSGTLSTLLAAPPLNLDLACNGIPLSITIPTLSTVTLQDNTCKGCGQANLDIVVFFLFFQRKCIWHGLFLVFNYFFFRKMHLTLVTRNVFCLDFIFGRYFNWFFKFLEVFYLNACVAWFSSYMIILLIELLCRSVLYVINKLWVYIRVWLFFYLLRVGLHALASVSLDQLFWYFNVI